MQQPRLKVLSRNRVKYLGTVYTRDQAVADLQSIQSGLDEGRMVSQKLYRELGSVPLPVIDALFGTYPEFKRQSGIVPTRHQNTIRNSIARFAAADKLQTIRKERLDYGLRYKRDSQNRHKIILAFSDMHDIEADPFMTRVLIDTAKRVQPDVIVSNGDHFDCPEFSKYLQDPREWNLTARLDAGLGIFKGLREASPDSQIDLIEGNHEARLVKHLSETSPATMALLSDWHGMSVRDLFKLDTLEINYVAAFDLAAYTDAQIRREIRKNSRVYFNAVHANHFPQARHEGLPGFNGHHHQHIVWTEYSRDRGSYEWHQLGCGHRRDASYTNGSKWNNGFALIHVDTQIEQPMFEYIHVGTTMAVVGGHRYERRPDEYYDALLWETPNAKPFGPNR